MNQEKDMKRSLSLSLTYNMNLCLHKKIRGKTLACLIEANSKRNTSIKCMLRIQTLKNVNTEMFHSVPTNWVMTGYRYAIKQRFSVTTWKMTGDLKWKFKARQISLKNQVRCVVVLWVWDDKHQLLKIWIHFAFVAWGHQQVVHDRQNCVEAGTSDSSRQLFKI